MTDAGPASTAAVSHAARRGRLLRGDLLLILSLGVDLTPACAVRGTVSEEVLVPADRVIQ